MKTFLPSIKWTEDKHSVKMTIDARDVKDEKIEIHEKEIVIDFSENNKFYHD